MNKFFDNIGHTQTTIYEKPPLIILSGVPGSGKTQLARELSRALQIYNISNDFVRNRLYIDNIKPNAKVIQIQTKLIMLLRIQKLLLNHAPFVYDANVSEFSMLKRFETISKLYNYELIKIFIESKNDEENINRILNKLFDLETYDSSVIGDNNYYSSPYPREDYFRILARKPINTDVTSYDYHLINEGTLEEFQKDIEIVSKDIKRRCLNLK